MAFIGHRCTCGHNDLNHTRNDKGKAVCTARSGGSCGKGCIASGEPELLPTFDRKGRHIEQITPPGDGLKTESGSTGVKTCICDACQALYAQLAIPSAA